MPFNNPTNNKRIEKIKGIIDQLEASAISNKADAHELLNEIYHRVAKYRDTSTATTPPPTTGGLPSAITTRPSHGKPHPWQTIRECAEKADLKDLGIALAVYMNRVDELLDEQK